MVYLLNLVISFGFIATSRRINLGPVAGRKLPADATGMFPISARAASSETWGPRLIAVRVSTACHKHPGTVAFSRAGDPDIGEFNPAEVLAVFGEVPEDLSEL